MGVRSFDRDVDGVPEREPAGAWAAIRAFQVCRTDDAVRGESAGLLEGDDGGLGARAEVAVGPGDGQRLLQRQHRGAPRSGFEHGARVRRQIHARRAAGRRGHRSARWWCRRRGYRGCRGAGQQCAPGRGVHPPGRAQAAAALQRGDRGRRARPVGAVRGQAQAGLHGADDRTARAGADGGPAVAVERGHGRRRPGRRAHRVAARTRLRAGRRVGRRPVEVGRDAGAEVLGGDPLGPERGPAHSPGPGQRDVDVVAVAGRVVGAGLLGGTRAVWPPTLVRPVGAPDLVVPDHVHHTQPAGVGVLVARGVGGEQPRDQLGGLGGLGRLAPGDEPVDRTALVVLAGHPVRAAVTSDAVAGARVGGPQQVAQLDRAGLGRRVAGRLLAVGGEGLDPGRKARRDPGPGRRADGRCHRGGRTGQRWDGVHRGQRQGRCEGAGEDEGERPQTKTADAANHGGQPLVTHPPRQDPEAAHRASRRRRAGIKEGDGGRCRAVRSPASGRVSR